jgi:hypothetical protein
VTTGETACPTKKDQQLTNTVNEVTNMIGNKPSDAFQEGDEVVLERGTYQGTPGVFVRLRQDINWADIKERDGSLWSHPVEWLAHAAGASH